MKRPFQIIGVDRDTADDIEKIVQATTAANAKVKAELSGIVVTEVKPVEEQAARRQSWRPAGAQPAEANSSKLPPMAKQAPQREPEDDKAPPEDLPPAFPLSPMPPHPFGPRDAADGEAKPLTRKIENRSGAPKKTYMITRRDDGLRSTETFWVRTADIDAEIRDLEATGMKIIRVESSLKHYLRASIRPAFVTAAVLGILAVVWVALPRNQDAPTLPEVLRMGVPDTMVVSDDEPDPSEEIGSTHPGDLRKMREALGDAYAEDPKATSTFTLPNLPAPGVTNVSGAAPKRPSESDSGGGVNAFEKALLSGAESLERSRREALRKKNQHLEKVRDQTAKIRGSDGRSITTIKATDDAPGLSKLKDQENKKPKKIINVFDLATPGGFSAPPAVSEPDENDGARETNVLDDTAK